MFSRSSTFTIGTIKVTPALAAFGTVLSDFQPSAPDAVTRLLSLQVQPNSISTSLAANRVAQGVVTLTAPAGPGGVTIALSCDRPELTRLAPALLPIGEGQTVGTFSVTGMGQSVMAQQSVDATVKARLGDQTLTTPVTLRPDTPTTPTDTTPVSFITQQTQQLENDILQAVNQHRQSMQLSGLSLDAACTAQARSHSVDMAAGRVPLGDEGFDLRVAAIRSSAAPGTPPFPVSEQVAAGSQTAAEALQGWLQENADYGTLKQSALSLGYVRPGDEADFVDDTPSEAPYSRVGVGVARSPAGMNYITIIFAA